MKQQGIIRMVKEINDRLMALRNGEAASEIFRRLIGNKLKGVVALQA
ncbi:MAG: hypothetical protein GY782_06610 [Gammaproteobacteria bacterium]|nr:hypothetical protein [Gammaproteobacteria bacterium]